MKTHLPSSTLVLFHSLEAQVLAPQPSTRHTSAPHRMRRATFPAIEGGIPPGAIEPGQLDAITTHRSSGWPEKRACGVPGTGDMSHQHRNCFVKHLPFASSLLSFGVGLRHLPSSMSCGDTTAFWIPRSGARTKHAKTGKYMGVSVDQNPVTHWLTPENKQNPSSSSKRSVNFVWCAIVCSLRF